MDSRLILLKHGLTPLTTAWRRRNVRSTFWRLYVHDRDGVEITVGDTVHRLGSDRVHLIPAWLIFDYGTPHPVEQFHVSFDLVRWTAAATQRLAAAPVSQRMDPLMRAAWSSVRAGYRRGGGRSSATLERVQALVHAALAGWIDQLDDGQVASSLHAVAGRHEIEPVLAYIENHLGDRIDNAALAALCHYSTDHFVKVFRGVVGQTPSRYVAERRVAAAAQALAFTDRSIDDVAESLGFGNRFYFSRVFKRHLGIPPSAYRADIRVT